MADSIANELLEKYYRLNPDKKPVVEKKVLKTSDAIAKAAVENLIENRFSVDVPTRIDAVNEMMSLAESKSFIADKIMEMFDDVTSNCSIDKEGNITLNVSNLKRKY